MLTESKDQNPEIEIQLSLRVETLDQKLEYTALSYTWGPPTREDAEEGMTGTPTHHITCNGMPLLVTENLFDCLQQLVLLGNHEDLWVDAICIDQGNAAEKNQQVNLMADIYRAAKQVIIWLGKADEQTSIARDFIQKFAASQYVVCRLPKRVCLSCVSSVNI